MKLQIDTKAKTIKVDETVKIVKLINVIKKLLPNEWQSYSLETGSVITWYSPITWHYYQPTIFNPLITEPYRVTCGDPITTSVYNVECIN